MWLDRLRTVELKPGDIFEMLIVPETAQQQLRTGKVMYVGPSKKHVDYNEWPPVEHDGKGALQVVWGVHNGVHSESTFVRNMRYNHETNSCRTPVEDDYDGKGTIRKIRKLSFTPGAVKWSYEN